MGRLPRSRESDGQPDHGQRQHLPKHHPHNLRARDPRAILIPISLVRRAAA